MVCFSHSHLCWCCRIRLWPKPRLTRQHRRRQANLQRISRDFNSLEALHTTNFTALQPLVAAAATVINETRATSETFLRPQILRKGKVGRATAPKSAQDPSEKKKMATESDVRFIASPWGKQSNQPSNCECRQSYVALAAVVVDFHSYTVRNTDIRAT